MKLLDSLRSLSTRFFFHPPATEMDEELQSHIQLRADDLERSGLSRAEAERRARIEFGSRERYREEMAEACGGNLLSSFAQDLRVSLRVLRKSPGFTITAILTLALAIGANSVVFSVMDALVFRSLDVPNRKQLYSLERKSDQWGYESYLNYIDLRDRNRSFNGLAAENFSQAGLDTGKDPSHVWLDETSGNYFDVLGLQPYLGRFFHRADEHGPNSMPYVVLSYAYWHSRFQEDRNVIGRVVQLNKHPFTILGVAPPGFQGSFIAFDSDMFVPIVNQEQIDGQNQLNDRRARWISTLIGSLKPGITRAQAVADLNSIGAALEKSYPKEEGQLSFLLVRPGPGSAFGGAIRMFLAGLIVLTGLTLLGACTNLGTLFAARAADRSREVALRLALGSSRRRILRQLLTEATLIGLGGGAVGVGLSMVLIHRLSMWRPFPQFPLSLPVRADASMYLLALILAVISGLLFGIVPVRQVLRANPYEVVKAGSTVSIGRRVILRDVLVFVQIAICALLITASLVAMRGLTRSLQTNLGVVPQNALLVDTDLGMAGYSGDRVPDMQKRMADAVREIPGVAAVGTVDIPPLHMGWTSTDIFKDQTTDLKPTNAAASPILYSVSPEYFSAAGTTLLAGRSFTLHDGKDAPRVAVINQEFAHKVFGSASAALGHYFKRSNGTRIQVVGIVEDGKYTANIAEDRQTAVFLSLLQSPARETWLVVRSNRDSKQLAEAVHSTLRNLDSGLPCFIQTWEEEMNGALFASRMATTSLSVLGMLGAMLSITGIFGMAAYSVSKRLKEFGIRIALGAKRRTVLKTALGRAAQLLAIGSLAGVTLGLLATRVLSFIVYEATPRDPLVLIGVFFAMLLLGMIAAWIPAQRALSVNPLELLHEE